MRKPPDYDARLIAIAKRAFHGLDESDIYVGILGSNKPLSAARIEFLMQLGHSILMDKPIIIPAPFGYDVPKKLVAVADRVVRYDPNRPETLRQNLAVALAELGTVKQ